MAVWEFVELIPSQKHQFGQLSMHEDTCIRAKGSRWEITASRWSTEIGKDALKKVGKTVSYHPRYPSHKPGQPSMERDTSSVGESEVSTWPHWGSHTRSTATPRRLVAVPGSQSTAVLGWLSWCLAWPRFLVGSHEPKISAQHRTKAAPQT